MAVTGITLMIGFFIVFGLSLVFMFLIKGTFKDLIALMGIFSIFAFIGGLVDLWLIIIFLIMTIVVIMIGYRGNSGGDQSE